MLLGFAVRDLGPLRYRAVEQLTPVHDEWLAMCRSIGTFLVASGLVVCLATTVALLVGVGDRTGSRVVMAIVALAVIGSGIWSVLAIRRFVALDEGVPDGRVGGDPFSVRPTPRGGRRARRGSMPTPVDEPIGEVEFDERDPATEPLFPADAFPEGEPAVVVPPWQSTEAEVPTTDERASGVRPASEDEPQYEPVPNEDVEVAPEIEAADAGQAEPRFSSRLLADVGDERDEPGQGFRSSLFAELDETATTAGDGAFSSSILADLGRSPNGSPAPEATPADLAPVDEGEQSTTTTTNPPDETDEMTASRRSSSAETEF